jgi:hypothetical protein
MAVLPQDAQSKTSNRGVPSDDRQSHLEAAEIATTAYVNHPVPSAGDMRRAIEQEARASGLVRDCLEVARTLRLGREETYLLIAYEALRSLEDIRRDRARSAERIRHRLRDGHF